MPLQTVSQIDISTYQHRQDQGKGEQWHEHAAYSFRMSNW